MGNPYYGRFASGPMARVIDDALAQNPTFFSLWIGNNDVLGYATTGGDGTDPITSTTDFDNAYNSLVNSLTQGGRKGVIANIPAITSAPFFKAVSFNPITVASLGAGLLPNGTIAEQIAAGTAAMNQLNAQLLGPLDQILTALGQPNRFVTLLSDDANVATVEPNNPLLMVDQDLPNLSVQIAAVLQPLFGEATAGFLGNLYGQARHARNTPSTDRDYILLTSRALIGTTQAGVPAPFNVIGISNPMQDSTVLSAGEVAEIKTATDAYNSSIRSVAESKNLAFVDANAVLNQVSNGGILSGTYHFTNQFVQGGTFGLDGVHLTARANAYIANKFLEAIEKTYGSSFKKYKPQDFPLSYPSFLP
jgi:lysophospholipase L1-like esterase